MTSHPFARPLVLGHRGSPFHATENTLASFASALEQGADGVELDVRRAHDGVPVVIHDETLDRTMPVKGRVVDFPWPAIQRLTNAALPSLEQVAAWAAASGAFLNVEIKSRDVEAATVEILTGVGVLERSLISSFDPDIVAEVGRLAPDSRRYLLTEAWDEVAQEAVASSGALGICLHVSAAVPLVLEVLRNEDLPVIVWTVDSPDRMRELFLSGVAGIITNRPLVAAEVRVDALGPH